MEIHGIENSFGMSIKKSLRKRSLALFCLAMPLLFAGALYLSSRFYGNMPVLKYGLPGAFAALWLVLLVLELRSWFWLSGRFEYISYGILSRDWLGREQAIPWSSVTSADVGVLSVTGVGEIKIIRCFLSAKAAARLSPNVNHRDDNFTVSEYYRLRRECFVTEYSPERERLIVGQWRRARDEEDAALTEISGAEDDFEYAFDEETRHVFKPLKGWVVVLIAGVYYGLVACVSLPSLFREGYSDEWLGTLIILSLMPLSLLLLVNKHAANWIVKSKCKLCRDGIYLMTPKKRPEFIRWTDFAVVGRQQMTLARATYAPVICCYRSLAAKTMLEYAPRQGTNDLMYEEFYNRRNEIVTLSYDKKRMAKIRSLRGAGLSKSKRMRELRNHDWDVFEKARDI